MDLRWWQVNLLDIYTLILVGFLIAAYISVAFVKLLYRCFCGRKKKPSGVLSKKKKN